MIQLSFFNYSYLSPLFIILLTTIHCTEPSWIGCENTSNVPGFPANRWMVGLSEESLGSTDWETTQKRVIASARAELAQSIRTRVTAVSTDQLLSERRSGAAERFAERFSSSSTSSSDIELIGLHSEFHQRGKRVYALAAVERTVMAAMYSDRADKFCSEAESKAMAAQTLEKSGRLAEAHDAWVLVQAPLAAANEDLSLVRLFGGNIAVAATLAALRSKSDTALARLAVRPIATLDDVADVLVRRLDLQAKGRKPLVLVSPLTLRGTRVPSPFGRLAAMRLTAALGRISWPTVVNDSQGTARERASSGNAQAVLLGTIWPQPDGSAHVIAEVITLANGTRLAVAEVVLPAAGVAASGEKLTPDNAAQALADQQAFAKDEVISQDFKVEIWTNKGDDAQIFTKGETMKVFVRVDRPCHLRLVYHLASGERVLLLDDRFIDEAKVNKVYEIPETFECDAPFGAETLQANVSTEAFAKLNTRQKGDYTVILGDLATQLSTTRGFKKKNEIKTAESRVVLTTVGR